MCSSPIYIENFGMPQHPTELEGDHFSVGYMKAQAGRVLPMEFRRGEELIEVSPRFILSVNDSRSYLQAAISGLGIIMCPLFIVKEAVEKGELVPVLPEWNRDPVPLYVVYPQTRHLSNRVRVFVDWLAKQLQGITRDPAAGTRRAKTAELA